MRRLKAQRGVNFVMDTSVQTMRTILERTRGSRSLGFAFLDMKGVVCVDFVPNRVAINASYYSVGNATIGNAI